MESIDTGRLNAFNNALNYKQRGIESAINTVNEGLGVGAKNVGKMAADNKTASGDIASAKGQLEAYISQHQSSTDPEIQELVKQAREALGSL